LKNKTLFPKFYLHKPTATGKNKFARLLIMAPWEEKSKRNGFDI